MVGKTGMGERVEENMEIGKVGQIGGIENHPWCLICFSYKVILKFYSSLDGLDGLDGRLGWIFRIYTIMIKIANATNVPTRIKLNTTFRF